MPKLAEVVFLSQAWAEAYLPRPGDAVISITDRGAPPASLNDGWTAVLRVSFDDVDPAEGVHGSDSRLVELQAHEADRIAAFVSDNAFRANALIVHCRHGQSRSAGVAKAVAQVYGLAFPAATSTPTVLSMNRSCVPCVSIGRIDASVAPPDAVGSAAGAASR